MSSSTSVPPTSGFADNVSRLLSLGLPIIISMLAIIGFGITDTLVAGQSSAEDLAALALGANIWNVAIVLVVGLMVIVTPRIAHARGAGDTSEVAHEGRQALWLALISGVIMLWALTLCQAAIPHLGAEAAVSQKAQGYLKVVAWSMPAIALTIALRAYCDGFGRTTIAMLIYLLGLPTNLVLNFWFVFGGLGLPAMGAVGCAVASVLVAMLEVVAFVVLIRKDSTLDGSGLLHHFQWPEAKRLWLLLCLGAPIAAAQALEEGFFSASALMIAPLGTEALGAHQVAVNLVMIGIMCMIGMGQGGSILVAEALGAQRPQQARQLCGHTLIVGMALAVVITLCLFVLREPLMRFFSADPALVGLGATVLMVVPIELIFESVLILSGLLLRGYQDTLVPALIQTFSYWGIGFPLGWTLTRTEWLGGPYGLPGLWWAFVVAVIPGAALAAWRLHRVSLEGRLRTGG